MWLELALLGMMSFGLSGFCLKWILHKGGDSHVFFVALYAIGSLVFSLKIMASGIKYTDIIASFQIHPIMIAVLLIVAMGSMFGNQAVAKAYQSGPASLTAPMVNANVVLVVVMSVVMFGEQLNYVQYMAILFLLLAVSILAMQTQADRVTINKNWWLWVLLSIVFVFSREGGLKIAQATDANIGFILLCAYLAAGLYFWFLSVRRHGFIWRPKYSVSIVSGALAGVCSALGLSALTAAMASGPASIVVPIFSIRSVVVVALSVVCFGERLGTWQWLAVGMVIAAVAVIGGS